MPRNGSGTYSLPQPPFTAGTVISSAAVNSDLSDIASALTGSLPRDGQAGMTGQLKATDGSSAAPSITFSNEATTGFSRVSAGVIGVDILGTQIGTISATGIVIPTQGTVPIGSVLDFAGSTAPAQWYLCYGQAVSRTTYASLFGAIGTTYGVGDGSTTFNLPDCRDYVIAGKGNMGGSDAGRLTTGVFGSDPTVLGNTGGSQTETLTRAQIPDLTSTNASQAITVAPVGRTTVPGTNGVIGGTQAAGGSQQSNPDTTAGGGGDWASVTTFTGSNSISVTSTGTSGGSTGTAHPNVQPSFIMNKIIYAGA